MSKKLLALLVLAIIFVFPLGAYGLSFSDVPEGHWAYEYVSDMSARGIINGTPDGRFLPNDQVTREQFAKMFVLSLGIEMVPNDNYFQDCEGRWSLEYVRAAYPYVGGSPYPNQPKRILFNPTAKLQRYEAARALSIYFGYDNTEDHSQLYTMFDDLENVYTPHLGYINQAVKHGLMQGSNFKFKPFEGLTRAEAATLIYRALKRAEERVPTPSPTPTPTPMVDKQGRPIVEGGELLDYIEITDEIRKHNLVVDGGFEEGIYKGYIGAGFDWRGWAFELLEYHSGIIKIISDEKVAGEKSLYYTAGNVYQYIPLQQDVEYVLIFHAKPYEKASVFFRHYDTYSMSIEGNGEWQQRAMKFILSDVKDGEVIRLELSKIGDAYFDDIIIVESKYVNMNH